MIKKTFLMFSLLFSTLGYASTEITIIKTVDSVLMEQVIAGEQKTLRDENLRAMVKQTAASAIDLGWDEGFRSHESFRDGDGSQFHITELRIEHKELMHMSVVVNGNYTENTVNGSHEGTYSCTVDIDRYEVGDDLVSEYALCRTDLGEEIEYEN